MSGGIYKIENLITGRIYIGKSKNISKRFKQHQQSLKGGYHKNKELQNDYNLYGENNFKFSILRKTDCSKKLYYYESYYVDKFDSFNNGYNIKALYNHKAIKFIEKDIEIYISKIKNMLPKTDKKQYTIYQEFNTTLRNYFNLDNYHIIVMFGVINNGYMEEFSEYTFNIDKSSNCINISYISNDLLNYASYNYFI